MPSPVLTNTPSLTAQRRASGVVTPSESTWGREKSSQKGKVSTVPSAVEAC